MPPKGKDVEERLFGADAVGDNFAIPLSIEEVWKNRRAGPQRATSCEGLSGRDSQRAGERISGNLD